MAKPTARTTPTRSSTDDRTAAPTRPGVDATLSSYAEALGNAMGNLRNKVDDWKGQRSHLVDQLSTMVNDAQKLLADLGHTATARVGRLGRRGRTRKGNTARPNPAGGLKPAKRTTRGLTEAGRAAISAAQKARWAQYKNKRVPK